MKTSLVRASVLALAFVGFAASSVVSYSQRSMSHVASASSQIVPKPLCAPSDTTYCGLQ